MKLGGIAQTVRRRNIKNQAEGKGFEDIFERQGRSCGLLIIKQPLACRPIGGGKLIPMKSDLDFKVISRLGDVAYIDTKSFTGDYFTYSDLNPKQVERACLYNEWNVPSGFVVWLRGANQVVYYPGHWVRTAGPRSRFAATTGVLLGNIQKFNLELVVTFT